MGSSSTKIIDVTQVNLTEWNEIGIHRQVSKIVQHKNGNVVAQLQSINLDPRRDQQRQIQIYQYRKSQNNALVSCLGLAQQKVKSSSICGSSRVLKVLTQRIPIRLNLLPQLSFPQTLYILSQSLRGYKDCYSKLGPFSVDDQMIGVNLQGEIKVWVNQNFAQNHPQIQKPLLQTSGSQIGEERQNVSLLIRNDQTQMVANICQVIERKNEFGRYPSEFALIIYGQQFTFNQAYRQIENYCKSRNIFVPQRLINIHSKINSFSVDCNRTFDYYSNKFTNYPARQVFLDSMTPFAQSEYGSNLNMYHQPLLISNATNQMLSPIKSLTQPSTLDQIPKFPRTQYNASFIKSPRTQALGSKVTFRLVSPQNSTLCFENSQFTKRF